MFIQTTIVIALLVEGEERKEGVGRKGRWETGRVATFSRASGRFGADGPPPLDAATRGGGATLTLLAARAYKRIGHAPPASYRSNNTLGIHPLFRGDSRLGFRFRNGTSRSVSHSFYRGYCRSREVVILVPAGMDENSRREVSN